MRMQVDLTLLINVTIAVYGDLNSFLPFDSHMPFCIIKEDVYYRN